jgi:hypothetical protein
MLGTGHELRSPGREWRVGETESGCPIAKKPESIKIGDISEDGYSERPGLHRTNFGLSNSRLQYDIVSSMENGVGSHRREGERRLVSILNCCWQCPAPHSDYSAYRECGGPPAIFDLKKYTDIAIPSLWESSVDRQAYGRKKRSLALNERPELQKADNRKNRSENPHDSGPSDHGSIRAWIRWLPILFGVIGSFVGVWSIVFWDGIGFWRWPLSLAGWAITIWAILQGLSFPPNQ